MEDGPSVDNPFMSIRLSPSFDAPTDPQRIDAVVVLQRCLSEGMSPAVALQVINNLRLLARAIAEGQELT